MRTLYLRKEYDHNIRKILIDMAFLATHKQIRLPKNYYEDALYLPFQSNKCSNETEKYYLTKDKIFFEDANHYFFKFPFKPGQVESVAD